MSDHDRGAYTPQTDAPLAFDARAPRGGRKPLPMALIGSGVVLLVLVAGIAMYYRNGAKPAGGAPVVVGQPVEAMKAAPDPNVVAKEADPAANLDVYKAPGAVATTAPPAFAPPPEAPKPRPAPALTVQTVDNAPVHVVPATPAPAAQGAVKPPVAVATAPVAAKPLPAVPAPAAAKPAVVATAPAPKPAAPAPAASGLKPAIAGTASSAPSGTLVQIGAYSSAALADKGWSDLAKAYPGPMGGKSKRVEPLERDGKTLFRTSVGGWSSKAQAQAFCDQMKAAGRACLVKG